MLPLDNLTKNEPMRPIRHLLTAVIAALTLAGVSALAEQRPNVIFIVDPLTEPAGDWATWVTPRIVLR
jgi:hypothetical protein